MKTKIKTTSSILIALTMILAASFLFSMTGCSDNGSGEKDDFAGTWQPSSGADYSFDGKGKGSIGHGSHKHTFTYAIDDDTLTLTFTNDDGHGSETSYTYKLDGDTLKLTDSKNKSIVYTRSK